MREVRASDRSGIRLRPLLDVELLIGVVAFLVALGVVVWLVRRRR